MNRVIVRDRRGCFARAMGAGERRGIVAALVATLLAPTAASASFLGGEALDTAANVLAWVVIVLVPVVGIVVFWMVHVLPEKIAHKRHHPQRQAIQTLCLLSLVFGGLLWPIAWLWAYTKPVLHKLAYGTGKVAHGHEDEVPPPPGSGEAEELKRLRGRIAELESKLGAVEGGKA